jgi:hypothetical protein
MPDPSSAETPLDMENWLVDSVEANVKSLTCRKCMHKRVGNIEPLPVAALVSSTLRTPYGIILSWTDDRYG